jgi:hypothetical protein
MLAEVFGADGLIVLVVVFIGFGVPLWAVIDAASRPSAAFAAARSSKALWISLIAVFWFLTGIIGIVLAAVYLGAIRPRVAAIQN